MIRSQPIHDLEWKQFLDNLPPLDIVNGPWVAGGSARKLYQGQGWQNGDVDVFFSSDDQRHSWQQEFDRRVQESETEMEPFSVTKVRLLLDTIWEKNSPARAGKFYAHKSHSTDNADTYDIVLENRKDKTYKLQIIKTRYSKHLMDLWSDFDFTISCFAADSNMVYYLPQAEQDTKDKVLRDHNSGIQRNRAMRIFKHYTYGFYVEPKMLLEAVQLMQEGDFDCSPEY